MRRHSVLIVQGPEKQSAFSFLKKKLGYAVQKVEVVAAEFEAIWMANRAMYALRRRMQDMHYMFMERQGQSGLSSTFAKTR
jgi:hypothetical protein